MKILDRYILKSFLLPFFATFFVVLLVFVLQILWLYADDIIGKGIGVLPIAEMMMYMSAAMVPMALPVAILLSSIMTFGNLSENSELSAFKAAGIPLFRIMLSLIVLMAFVSYGAFLFANKVIPYANFKYENMLRNIVNQKPSLNLEPGVFTSVGDFSIRVNEKLPTSDEKKDSIRGALIYDLSDHSGVKTVIVGESGSITTSDDKRYMILTLYNGYMDDMDVSSSYVERRRQRVNKTTFDRQVFPIDISAFSIDNISKENESGRHTMLDIEQLSYILDSLKGQFTKQIEMFAQDIETRGYLREVPSDSTLKRDTSGVSDTLRPAIEYLADDGFFDKGEIYRSAVAKVRSDYEYLDTYSESLRLASSMVNNYGLEIQRKYALAFSVIVLFFIGAPLGALIRKGGLGLPVVVAIGIFMIYHILFMTGERMGKEGTLDVVTARWLPTWILLPFGIWLTYRATKDAVIVNLDPLLNFMDRQWARVPQEYKDKLKFLKRKKNEDEQYDDPQ